MLILHWVFLKLVHNHDPFNSQAHWYYLAIQYQEKQRFFFLTIFKVVCPVLLPSIKGDTLVACIWKMPPRHTLFLDAVFLLRDPK